nr:S-layer homology domain-containing protein [Paenibacillus sp. MSJ-34]
MVLLAFVVVAGGFPAVFAPQVAEAAETDPIKWLTYKFDINDFSEKSQQELFQLNGQAAFSDGRLIVNPGAPLNKHIPGSAFNKQSFQPHEEFSFSTGFSFVFNGNPGKSADGMTFAIVTDLEGLGDTGGGMGIQGVAPSFSLKFDTYKNGDPYFDPSYNYIGIAIDGDITNTNPLWYKDLNAADMRDDSGNPKIVLANGKTYYAWIDYDGASSNVKVYLNDLASKPDEPLINAENINLKDIFNDANAIYTGFTGVGYNESHEILSWYFVNDFAPIGDLDDTSGYQQAPSTLELEVGTASQGAYPIVITAKNADGNPAADVPITITGSQNGTWKDADGNPITDWSAVTTDSNGQVIVYYIPGNVFDPSDLRATAVGGAIATGTISAFPSAPGGVIDKQPVLWLKADDGATEDSGKLKAWNDQSENPVEFTLDVPVGQEARTPKYNANGVNFNPSVTFSNPTSANHYGTSAKLVGDKQITFQSGYAVYKPNGGALVGSTEIQDYGAIILGSYGANFAVGTGKTGNYRYIPGASNARYQLVQYEIEDTITHTGKIDGKPVTLTRNDQSFGPIKITPVVGATAGTKDLNWGGLNGEVAEIILFDGMTTSDAAKIETYLAVKYGITLNDGNSDYVATSDVTVWDATKNSGYKNNIAGIGLDTIEGLHQKQSRSINTGTQIVISSGQLTETNEPDGSELADGQYLIWGDNGDPLVFDKQIGITNEYRAQRVWKVQNTGGVGLVQVAIPVSAIPAGKKLIVSDSDTDFTTAIGYELEVKDLNGVPHYVATVQEGLADEQFFTYGVQAPTPQTVTLEEVANDGGNEIILTFDQEIADGVTTEGFAVTVGDALEPVEISEIVVEGNKVKLKLSKELRPDDTLRLKYEKPTDGNLKGTNGAFVLDFDRKVDNNLIAFPSLEITEPSGDTVYIKNPEIKGTADKEAKVEVTIKKEDGTVIGPVEVEVAEDGTWSFIPSEDLSDGKYTIEVTAEKDGKESKESKDITVDTSKPSLQITDPIGDIVYEANPEIKGTADKEAKVEVTIKKEDGTVIGPVEVEVAEDGTWSFIPSEDLSDGKYTIEVTAEKNGKVSKESKDITVDTTNVVDKTVLKQKAKEISGKITAGEFIESEYTQASWTNLANALEAAESVLRDPNATQDQVNQALTALDEAEKNLVKVGGELDGLTLVGLIEDGQEKPVNLTPEFDPIQYKNYYGTVTNDVYGINLNPTAKYPNETQVKVYVNGKEYFADEWNNLPLVEGKKNEIKVVVYDKTGKPINEYTIEIVREGAATANNKLASLVPSVGSLYPAFDPNRDSYTMSVSNSVYRIQFTPTALDPDATIQIRVNGGEWKEVPSGELSDYLALNVGTNTIVVRVTDQDGTFKDYTVTVTRASGSIGGGSSSGSTDSGTTTPSTSGNNVKPGDIVSTVDGSKVPFATGTVTQTGDRTQTTVTIDRDKLSGILANGKGQKLGIGVPGDVDVEVRGLTAEDLKKLADTGSSLDIENLLAIYPVPAGQLDLNAISKQFGKAPLGDIAANIKITRSADDLAKLAREKAEKAGYELLVHPVDLDLTFTHDGQTNRAGLLNGYAVKYIALPEGVDPNRITTGVIVNPDGTVFHVPTVVTKINNRYFAKINDLRSSGTYSVIWNPKDFNDVKNHWAKASANDIAARLVIEGTGNNNFTPDRDINRSEFAVFIVKGLGLMRQDVKQNVFHDVSSSAWYHAAVTIANEFGIVLGYDDGAFHGERYITREQGMAMIARGYKLIRPEASMSEGQVNAVLSTFGDANQIAPWAKEAVALLISEGITEGKSGQLLKPQDRMTRAEAAALIQRMLKTTELID